jgi:hypothetical protein
MVVMNEIEHTLDIQVLVMEHAKFMERVVNTVIEFPSGGVVVKATRNVTMPEQKPKIMFTTNGVKP